MLEDEVRAAAGVKPLLSLPAGFQEKAQKEADRLLKERGSSFDALGRWPFYAEVVVGWLLRISGADRDRTGDPLVANQVLSQLSYRPERVAK